MGGNRAADRITFFKTDVLRNSRLKHITSEPLGQRVWPRIGKDALLLVFLQRTQWHPGTPKDSMRGMDIFTESWDGETLFKHLCRQQELREGGRSACWLQLLAWCLSMHWASPWGLLERNGQGVKCCCGMGACASHSWPKRLRSGDTGTEPVN